MEDSILIEILKEMQKKYQCVVEIERLTGDIGESLSRNDRTTVQMLLGMRQEEMDKADLFEKNINYFVTALPPRESALVKSWIKGLEDKETDSEITDKIVKKGKSIQLILKRTIEIDKHISMRMAGTHSFYH